MGFTETDLNQLATAKILNHYTEPFPYEERQHTTQVVFYPKEPYINLRGYGRNNRMDHITVEQALAQVHPEYREEAQNHFKTLMACTEDCYQFSIVMHPWTNQYDYRVIVISLFADYEDNSDRIIRYTGTATDMTRYVYDRRMKIKFKHKALFLEEQFKTALWSVDPDGMMLYCDKVGHDDFYHDYDMNSFINLVDSESQPAIRKVLYDMHTRSYDMNKFLLHVWYQDGSEHYLQCKPDKLFNERGEIFRYLIYSYDVTEQKKMEFKNKTFHAHLHKMMEETGIHLFYYTPGSKRLHMEDPQADPRLININITDYIERVHEDDRGMFKDIFDHCDKCNLDRQDFSYRLMPFNDDAYHRYDNIVLPVFDEKNELQMYGFIRMDVTHDYNSQTIFKYAQNVSKIGAWMHDLTTGKRAWTDGMFSVLDINNKKEPLSFDELKKYLGEDGINTLRQTLKVKNCKQENEYIITHKINTQKGNVKHVELRIHIDHDNKGKAVFAYGTMMDITDRVKLAKEKEKADTLFHTVIRHLPSLVFIKDIENDFRIVAANEAYAQYFGKSLDEINGKGLKEYSNEKETAEYIKSDQEAAGYTADHPKVEYLSHVNADGERRYYQKSKFGQMVSGRKLLICTATDVTELQKAKNKAEESDLLKSAFLANMSHEIRTPLNAIVGFSDLIVNKTSPDEDEKFQKIIHDNSEHLLRLISDILVISKLEANAMKYSFTEFNLLGMIQETYMSMKNLFKIKGIELIIEDFQFNDINVYQDRIRVAEILNNFLTNAYKHTSKGNVTISLDILDKYFRINVTDTGEGIEKEKLHSIFNRFEKLDEFKEGTGLGLAICEGLTKALGGKIGVNSELGKGSTFWVELPIHAKEKHN